MFYRQNKFINKNIFSHLFVLTLATITLISCSSAPIIPPNALYQNPSKVNAEIKWQINVGKNDINVDLSPIVVNNQLYASSSNGNVIKADANGETIWRVSLDEKITAGVGADKDIVAIATASGKLIALASNTGKEVWSINLTNEIIGPPLVTPKNIVVRTIDGIYYGFDKVDGKRLWLNVRPIDSLTIRSAQPMLFINDAVVATSQKATIYVFLPQNGKLIWERQIARARGTSAVEKITDFTSPAVSNGKIICAGAYQSRSVCMNLTDGNIIWVAGEGTAAGVAISANELVEVNMKDELVGYKLNSGEKLWQNTALFNRSLTTPIIFKDKVVVADGLGYLHIINPLNGEFLGYVATREAIANVSGIKRNPRIITTAPTILGDLLIIQSQSGTLYAIHSNIAK